MAGQATWWLLHGRGPNTQKETNRQANKREGKQSPRSRPTFQSCVLPPSSGCRVTSGKSVCLHEITRCHILEGCHLNAHTIDFPGPTKQTETATAYLKAICEYSNGTNYEFYDKSDSAQYTGWDLKQGPSAYKTVCYRWILWRLISVSIRGTTVSPIGFRGSGVMESRGAVKKSVLTC
jgi:hypothetical protein